MILTRTRLEKIITDFDLYPDLRKTGIMEDVVEQMRKDLNVQIFKGDAFKVSYEGPSPRTVAQVTDQLASLFIEESLKDRASQTEGTSSFLESELEDARRSLEEQEKKVEQYRMKFSGQLPTQLDSNQSALHNTQLQIQATVESINSGRDRRLIVQRELADVQAGFGVDQTGAATSSPPPAPTTDPADGSTKPAVMTTAQQLAAAKMGLTILRERGERDDHPDVKAQLRLIDDLQKKVNTEELQRPVSANTSVENLSPAERLRRKRQQDLTDELAQIDKQIAALQAEEQQLRGGATDIQKRIDAVPARESEFTQLTRDYSTLQTIYQQLLTRKEESNIASNLERRQIGEQFRLLDPAHVPERPVSPNRKQIDLMGFGIGLGVAVALVVLLEYRDSAFRTSEELRALLNVQVLAVVPMMLSDGERRSSRRRRWLLGIGCGSTVVICAAVLAYTLVR
jgi:polysaccharide chain length determinant protein (PEP-CTERM system associated)